MDEGERDGGRMRRGKDVGDEGGMGEGWRRDKGGMGEGDRGGMR